MSSITNAVRATANGEKLKKNKREAASLERRRVELGARRKKNLGVRLWLRQFDGLVLLQYEQSVELLRHLVTKILKKQSSIESSS